MAHYISALVAKAPVNQDSAKQFNLPVFIHDDFAIIALNAAHSDYWSQHLGMPFDSYSNMFHDGPMTREFASCLGLQKYALIQTDYFGGAGEQYAKVYSGPNTVMEATKGGINEALSMIGIVRTVGSDEFETLGLDKYRSFENLFKQYAIV